MEEADGTHNIAPGAPPARKETPLPWAKVIPVYLALFCEAFNSSSIFAYVGYMVLDFGMSKNEKDSSYMYYAGILGSCFFAAQLLSSFFWGTLSDRIGRRPVLLIGQCGSMCASVLFGLAPKYHWAVAARSLNGLLNGGIGVAKTYLGEICDSTNVARGFSYVGLMWGFGSILGSVFGGLLARPAVLYPKVFSADGIFGRYPYLIPNLIAATVTAVGFVLCYLYLTENPRRAHGPSAKETMLREELGLDASVPGSDDSITLGRSPSTSPILRETSMSDLGRDDEDMVELSEMSDISGESVSSPSSPIPGQLNEDQNDDRLVGLDAEEGPAQIGIGSWAQLSDGSLPWYRRGWMAKVTQLPGHIASLPIFGERAALLCCLLYAMFGAMNTMADEVWPLWALTPVVEGGLAFSTDLIGICNAWAGATNLFFNLILYPILVRRWGFIKVFQIGTFGSILIFPIYPLFKYVPLPTQGDSFSYLRFWFLLGVLILFRFCFSQAGFSSIMTLISNSVYPETMGSANGLGQSMVAFTRMLAPFTAAAILALSIGTKAIWPFNYGRLAWWSISAVSLLAYIVSFRLPTSLNKPRIEAEADKNAALQNNSMLTVSISSDSEIIDTPSPLSDPSSTDEEN